MTSASTGALPLTARLLLLVTITAWLASELSAQPVSDVAPAPKVHRGHAIAMHGEPKYGPDFKHFEYVDPNAPKGGTMRLGVTGTFDSFNPYIIKGNAASGAGAETLLARSVDEAFTEYGLIAETIEWPEDRTWVIFTLRPEAHWHDGAPITAEDVVFSFETLKTKGRPFFRFYYGSVSKVEALGKLRVKFTFSEQENRELPLIIGQMPILPKHYWEGRDFERSTLEPPLASGPYRVANFEPGRHVIVERVEGYWGRDLPINVGRHNFDRIRYDYFRDDTIVRQVLKAGDIDLRVENQAKAWALDYNVPATRDGWLVKKAFQHKRPTGMQAFIYNMRRPLFQSSKVRRALAYAFDFEWTNPNLFFGQYTRTKSYFSNSELASFGLPQGEELALLEPHRDRLPIEVFTTEYTVPVSDGSGWPRDNLMTATKLLAEAGWVVRDLKLVNAETGAPFTFEILLVSQAFERIVLPFTRNLKRLGIDIQVRLVDQSQYINRLRSFDFDMVVGGWGQSDSPGNEQRDYWSTEAASRPGSRNWVGIEDPVIDDLIECVISAPDRDSLIVRTRALDRVLLWGNYVIPQWHVQTDRMLYWDKFGQPEIVPKDGVQVDTWWYDEDKAARLDERLAIGELADAGEASDTPASGTVIAAALGLSFFAWLLFRRVTRPQRP